MGFFKNLFKGKFKQIGKNFAKNLKNGRLVKGTGFDGVINSVASPITSKASAILGGPDVPSGTGGYRPSGTLNPAQVKRSAINPNDPIWTYDGGTSAPASSPSTIAGISITTLLLIGVGIYMLKKK